MEISTFISLLDHLESVEDSLYCFSTDIPSSISVWSFSQEENRWFH